MNNRYRNPWASDTLVRRGSNFYENNAPCIYDADGWQVFRTQERGFDYVYAGCCITQRAGVSNPNSVPPAVIAEILSGEHYVCDEVGAHLRAHGLTCKTYADASQEHSTGRQKKAA